jgi:hypothetical protein
MRVTSQWPCGVRRRPSATWNSGFKSQWGHKYSSVCCVGSGLCDELITRLEESYRVCVWFLAGIKVQWDVDGGRLLLGDNTDGVTVMLRPFNSTPLCVCVCVCVCVTYIFTVDHMHTQFRLAPDLPECNYCVTQGVPVTSSFYILQKCNSQVSFHASHQQLQAPVASAGNTSEILVLAILFPLTGRMGSASLTWFPVAQMTWQPLRSYNMDTDTHIHSTKRSKTYLLFLFRRVRKIAKNDY